MIHGVLALADSSVASIMVPRPDVYWIDLADELKTIEREIADCPYSRSWWRETAISAARSASFRRKTSSAT